MSKVILEFIVIGGCYLRACLSRPNHNLSVRKLHNFLEVEPPISSVLIYFFSSQTNCETLLISSYKSNM